MRARPPVKLGRAGVYSGMLSRRARAAAALVAAVLASCGSRGPGDGPRNLLLVVWDTTRADRLSCYGHDVATTPRLDALAARGARFTDAVAHSSLTPVSMGSLLTGTLPYRHGVRSLFQVHEQRLAADVPAAAELFAGAGRRTAGFVGAAPMGSKYGFARGFDTYDDSVGEHAHRLRRQRAGNAYQRRADEVTDDALAWLDEHAAEPFALLVHCFDPHDGSLAPPRAFLEERLPFELPADFDASGTLHELEGTPRWPAVYDAEIAFLDAQLGRLLDRLDELGVGGETLVVVTADHGEGLGDHGFWTHGLLWEEQLRVPLVVAGPGVAPGLVPSARVRLVDVLPTLAELFDLRVPAAALDGVSFADELAAGSDGGRPEPIGGCYAEVHHALEDRLGREPAMYSLTLGRWKYVHRPHSGAHELYDLQTDPHELTNLAGEEPRVVRVLRADLARRGAIANAEPISVDELSEEERTMLQQLGYL